MNDDFNPNAQENAEQNTDPNAGGAATETPPPQPDPLLEEFRECFEELKSVREKILALASKDGLPPELAGALNQIASKPVADQMGEAINNVVMQDASTRMAHAVRKSHPSQWEKTGETIKSQFDKFTQEAKKLYRIEDGRVLAGVCTGLADYLNIDVTIVRVIFVVLGIVPPVTLFVILIYFFMAMILPEKKEPTP
ncbi:MAG: PspC domain-containing protein [Candidatus Hinthialibacter antarcticus]|nr:PspC domain-containing protein [Candidatus Hinthialibacter antarcticus]